MKVVGAIDQGTTGTRFMLFDYSGSVIDSSYKEHQQIFPKPGWVEHDPLEIWQNTKRVIKDVLNRQSDHVEEIVGLGVTNQRETTIIWDKKTGKPLHNALVWQDTRTDDICKELSRGGYDELITETTGLKIATYFSGSKIKWLLDSGKGIREKAEKGEVLFGNIDSWLIWNLTSGTHVTDYTNASRTMLMNLRTLEWDTELLELLDIPLSILPEIRPSSDREYYGECDSNLGMSIPVCGDLGDQQAALFGQTCFEPGECKNTYGTGLFLLTNLGKEIKKSHNGLLTTCAYSLEKGKSVYALEGSIAIGGAVIQWLRDQLQIIDSAPESEPIAESVSDTGGVYFVPAFVGLFAPYWDASARGTILGITRGTNRSHITRAALEAICYQTRDVLEAMVKDSGIKLKNLRVDGGASKNNFLMQLQADILGIKCMRPKIEETTALGAAYAAGLACGFWENMDDLRKNWSIDQEFNPQIEDKDRNKLYDKWQQAVERSRAWIS